MMNFIKRERIYIWMVIFILGINLLSIGHVRKKDSSDKVSISSMTFKDMGVTEEKVKLFFESKKPSAVFFRYSLFVGFLMLIAGTVMDFIFLHSRLKTSSFQSADEQWPLSPSASLRTEPLTKSSGLSIPPKKPRTLARVGFIFGKKEVMPEKISEKKFIAWGLMDVIRVAIIVIFSGYIVSVGGSLILKQLHFNMDVNLRMMFGTFFIDIITGIVIVYFVLVKYGEKLSSLGIAFESFYKNVLSGITAYIFIMPILAMALILSMMFLDAIGYKSPPQPVFDMFFEEKRNNVILFLTIFVSILGPVIEEVFFRGFLYSAVRKRFGVFLGVLLSSALFSILHANIVGFLPIMILGVLMAFLYERTGSLIASVSIHILHNSIIVGFVFFIKEVLK